MRCSCFSFLNRRLRLRLITEEEVYEMPHSPANVVSKISTSRPSTSRSQHMLESGIMFSVLRERSLRWVFIANVVSMLGSGMNSAAVAWYILQATHSEIALGTF